MKSENGKVLETQEQQEQKEEEEEDQVEEVMVRPPGLGCPREGECRQFLRLQDRHHLRNHLNHGVSWSKVWSPTTKAMGS